MAFKPKTAVPNYQNHYQSVKPANNQIKSALNKKRAQSQDKDQYYKFYLESAQRAIEMMRKQHRVVTKNDDLTADYKSQQDNAIFNSQANTQYSHTAINFNNNFDLSNKNAERTSSVQYSRVNKSKRILDPITGPNKSMVQHESPEGAAASTKYTQ